MIELNETLSDIGLEISFNKYFNKAQLVNETAIYIDYVSMLEGETISLYENNEWCQDFEVSLLEALTYVEDNLLDIADDNTSYTLKVDREKPTTGKLYFYSYSNFAAALSDNLKSALHEIDRATQAYEELYVFDVAKSLSFKPVIENCYNSENIFHRYNFDIKLRITPEHLYKWGEEFEDICPSNIFFAVSTYMSLVIFSNKSKKEENVYHFFFDGLTSIALDVNFTVDTPKIQSDIHDLFRWVFEDTGAVAKISIIRNIFTTNGFTSLEQAFTKETIYAIESNHQLYQEDNVKQYFEIKNKVVDFIFGISNKMSDSYDSYYNSNKINLVAILSYIVTLLVIRGMSKSNFDSAVNLFCYLSLAFFIVAFIYTKLVQSELDKKVKYYQKQKDELYSRYKNMLCEVELTQLFSSPSYDDAKCRSEEAKFHYVVYAILTVFIIIDIVIIGIKLGTP
ncbi:MAG: hypothetical protein ACJAXJ_003378 [Colwellia sp.]|jgi:hypothetical protein